MEGFIKGDIVVVPFPFTDLTDTKRRPTIIITVLEGNDVILCPITTQKKKDRYAVSINDTDFEFGELKERSIIKPNCVFTADRKLILYKIGRVKPDKVQVVIEKLIDILKR